MWSARSCEGPTGQPGWYDDATSAAVTAETALANVGTDGGGATEGDVATDVVAGATVVGGAEGTVAAGFGLGLAGAAVVVVCTTGAAPEPAEDPHAPQVTASTASAPSRK